MLLVLSACLLVSLSSCLKEYTCECERTYYNAYRTDSTTKTTASLNGSRKAPVIQDCNRLADSVRDDKGTGHITRCQVLD